MTNHLQADIVEGLRRGLLLALAVLAVVTPPLLQPDLRVAQSPVVDGRAPVAPVPRLPRFADFDLQEASADARYLADWVADSADNGQHGFVIIDKKDAKAYVFDANAVLRASTPVLLGAARGDDSVPGIGTRPIPDVKPHERANAYPSLARRRRSSTPARAAR